jgi:hypothetical protein
VIGTVVSARPASANDAAQLELAFSSMERERYKVRLSAVVAEVENARESVDPNGVIKGIEPAKTYSSRINQGIAKLENNDRLAALAGMIEGAKQVFGIQDANANIDYDPGAEMILRLTASLDWRGPMDGPEAQLKPFPDQSGLIRLVNSEPLRTIAVQPQRPSDVTNLMFIATEDELRAAFEAAGWTQAARLNAVSKLETARALIESRGYREGPMSVLLLDGQPPDFSLQKGNDTFAKRHHLRIFRRPGTFAGKPIWVCSATHDIAIEFSERDNTFIHKIDPKIDVERAKVVEDLLFTGRVKSIELVDRPEAPVDATNATGDPLQTDGRMAVLMF